MQTLYDLINRLQNQKPGNKKRGHNTGRGRSSSRNGRGGSANNSRPGSRAQSGSRPRSGSKGRGASGGKNKKGNRGRRQYNGFPMVQMPTPILTESEQKKLSNVYDLYHREDKTPAWPEGVGSMVAFESSRSDGINPMTIVARKLRQTKKTKQYVNTTSIGGAPTVQHLEYTSTTYDDEKHTFLLYNGKMKPAASLGDSVMTDQEDTKMSGIFKETIAEAKSSWVTGVYYLFYSIALTSTSRTPQKKSKNCMFISILVPCTRISDITETNIREEQQLGTVQVKAFPKINAPVSSREDLLSKYKDFIYGMNYDHDCKLTTEQLESIDHKFKNIMTTSSNDPCKYVVKRVSGSVGDIQVIQSDKIKFGERFGIPDKTSDTSRMKLQMVCPMPGMSAKSKTTVQSIVKHVMHAIEAKVRSEDYRKVMGTGSTWNGANSRKYVKALLKYSNLCFFYRIMHYTLGNQRILQLKNVMQTWSAYFEEHSCLPSKDSLAALKVQAKPTDEVPLRYKERQHPDDSTDEDEGQESDDDTSMKEDQGSNGGT